MDADTTHPVFPGRHLEMADEISGGRNKDRKDPRGRERRDKKSQGGEQDSLHEQDRHSWDEVPTEGGFFDFGESGS